MSQENPATIDELEASLPGASSDFILSQLKRQATVHQALQAYNAELVRDVERLKQKPRVGRVGGKLPSIDGTRGIEALNDVEGDGGSYSGNATEEWNDQLQALVDSGMPRPRAVSTLANRNPALREAMVEEANAGR